MAILALQISFWLPQNCFFLTIYPLKYYLIKNVKFQSSLLADIGHLNGYYDFDTDFKLHKVKPAKNNILWPFVPISSS
jgi:hypothetical protein